MISTKLVMTSSAILLAIAGVALLFGPHEILIYFQRSVNHTPLFLIQILGALYFSFAMLNWMTKRSLIGGIYNKPIAIANSTHFSIAGLVLLKGLFAETGLPLIYWIVAMLYLFFAVAFARILFRHPAETNKETH